MEEKKDYYSFSRLDNFNTCKRQFYLTYIEKKETEEGVYGYLGGVFHNLLENLQKSKITIEEAKETFKKEYDFCELIGMKFPTDKSGESYYENLMLYLDAYKPIKADEFHTEEEFYMDINGISMKGFIDLYYIIGDNIYVVDYKTSSKFQKKELPKKERQLILYGLYLKTKYPDKNIKSLAFDMCKYSLSKRKALKLREEVDNTENAYVYVDFSEEKIQELKKFIEQTKEDIQTESKWEKKTFKKEYDFFCKHICSVNKYCN